MTYDWNIASNTKDNLLQVIQSLNEGDIVEVIYSWSDLSGEISRVFGTSKLVKDKMGELCIYVGINRRVKVTDMGRAAHGLNYCRVVKRTEAPLPKEPPVGTWVRDNVHRVWVLKEGGLWSLRGGDTRTFYRWKELLEYHGPVCILTPGDPISG
jgi:hypothetical protein